MRSHLPYPPWVSSCVPGIYPANLESLHCSQGLPEVETNKIKLGARAGLLLRLSQMPSGHGNKKGTLLLLVEFKGEPSPKKRLKTGSKLLGNSGCPFDQPDGGLDLDQVAKAGQQLRADARIHGSEASTGFFPGFPLPAGSLQATTWQPGRTKILGGSSRSSSRG